MAIPIGGPTQPNEPEDYQAPPTADRPISARDWFEHYVQMFQPPEQREEGRPVGPPRGGDLPPVAAPPPRRPPGEFASPPSPFRGRFETPEGIEDYYNRMARIDPDVRIDQQRRAIRESMPRPDAPSPIAPPIPGREDDMATPPGYIAPPSPREPEGMMQRVAGGTIDAIKTKLGFTGDSTYEIPEREPDYEERETPQFATETGSDAMKRDLWKHAAHRWQQAQGNVAQAGREDYVDVGGLGDLMHNIGQMGVVGKGATALVNSADLVLNLGAETVERAGGSYYYSNNDNLAQELGVGNDPIKQEAFNAAMGVAYSGREAVKDAYNDALALAEQGQLTENNKEIVQAANGVWWREAIGQMILDPLAVVDVVGAAGKAVKMGKWGKASKGAYLAKWTDETGDLVKTSQVVEEMAQMTSRSGQAKEAETAVDWAMSYAAPRLKQSMVHREATKMAQVAEVGSGIANKQAVAKVAKAGDHVPGTEAFEQAVKIQAADDFQQFSELLARTASDDIQEVENAVEGLRQFGFGNIGASKMGRRTGVVLKGLMTRGDGYDDVMSILDLGRETGAKAEDVASMMYRKAGKVLDDLMVQQKFEQTALQKTAKALIQNPARKALDKTFGALFMGLNPGYALRNFYDNVSRMMLNGHSPLGSVKKAFRMQDDVGFGVYGSRAGIGQAEMSLDEVGSIIGDVEDKMDLPVTVLAQNVEKFTSQLIADDAYTDALGRMWKTALDDLDVPEELAGVVDGLVWRDITAIDELAAGGTVERWTALRPELRTSLSQTDPRLPEHIENILANAETPEDAIADLRVLQQTYLEHAGRMGREAQPVGSLDGTMTAQALDLAAQSGKFENLDELKDLDEFMAGLENNIARSRALAFESIMNSIAPDRWTGALDEAEQAYQETLQTLSQRQLVGYVKLLAGEITPEQYVKHTKRIFNSAYNDLDSKYSFFINVLGRGDTLNPADVDPLRALKWQVARDANHAGVPSVFVKTSDTTMDSTPFVRQAFSDATTVPHAHFMNKVRKILRTQSDKPGVQQALANDAIQSLNDLDYDDLLLVTNELRREAGRSPLTLDQVIDRFAGKSTPAVQLSPLDTPQMRAIPEELDLQEIVDIANRTTDPQIKAAAQAALTKFDIAPAPNPAVAAADQALVGVEAIDEVVDTVMEQAMRPPISADTLPPGLLDELRQRWTDTHVVSAEMARRARNFSLLDYSDRRTTDVLLKAIFPWHYWWSRSIPNWMASVAARPNLAGGYMRLKKELREYNDNDPTVPEWAKEHIVVNVPGYPGKMYLDYEAAFNAVGSIFGDDFSDPDQQRNTFGEIISTLGNVGPAPHPFLMMAYAGYGWATGDDVAARSYGYISQHTRAFAGATGMTVEPWLWLRDPETGSRLPFTGGSKWDVEKATRKLGYDQGQGEYTPEEAIYGAATHSGEAFEETLANDILGQYRLVPVLASSLLGLRLSVRQDWENEITDVNHAYSEAKDAGNDQLAGQILDENPWLSTVWLSWDNEAVRTERLATNVFHRLPPMPGEQRTELLEKVGLSEPMIDLYYEYKNDPNKSLADMHPKDYRQLREGVFDLATLIGVPDRHTAKEWREAKNQSRNIYRTLETKFPQGKELQAQYFKVKEAQGDDAAREFLNQNPDLSAYWDRKNEMLLDSPLVLKYYQEPMKVDTLAESLAYDQLEQQYPNIWQLRKQASQIEDFQEKREFHRLHPEVRESYDLLDEYIKQNRNQLRGLREMVSSGRQARIPTLIEGADVDTVNKKRAVEFLDEVEQRATTPIPEPEERPEKFTPQQKQQFALRDQIYAQVVAENPDLPALEREYDQIEKLYGEEAAKNWAFESGLYDLRDQITAREARTPDVLVTMDDEDLKWAGKALKKEKAKEMWPGIFQTFDEYSSIPQEDKQARREFWKAHPQLGAYMDWKEGADEYYANWLRQQRTKLRKQQLGG